MTTDIIEELRDYITSGGRVITQEIREYIEKEVDSGQTFSNHDVYNWLQLATIGDKEEQRKQKQAAATALRRISEDEGIIKRWGTKAGIWKKVSLLFSPIDFVNAPTDAFDIDLPFNLSKIINVYPADIICFAGKPNAGKTTAMFHIIKKNMKKWGKEGIFYMTNELRDTSLRRKLELHKDIALGEWEFTAVPCFGDYEDAVQPNAINIFDWIAMADASYMIENVMGAIKAQLDTGIAIICIQKKGNYKDMKGREVVVDLGTGGWKGVHYPTLYCAMDYGRAKIIKAKDWKTAENPQDKICNFKIYGGSKLEWSDWHDEWEK